MVNNNDEKKFIVTSLDNDNTKDIADVLGSKTCKKILDYLAGVKEASEKDIADALKIPINTIEYNLKKLIKSGFIKTTTHFWSVKGKKIKMYKLANKHIIISPSRKPDYSILKILVPIFLILFFAGLITMFYFNQNHNVSKKTDSGLKQFSSMKELNEFLKKNVPESDPYFIPSDLDGRAYSTGSKLYSTGSNVESLETADDYSGTNIQVQGVDEADIVKNDGKYIYVVSDKKVIIVSAYPAEKMRILSEIKFDYYVKNIYLNKDKLVVILNDYSGLVYPAYAARLEKSSETSQSNESNVTETSTENETFLGPGSLIKVYSIKDRENPVLENSFKISGNYVNSRMIGDYVYIINKKFISNSLPLYSLNGNVKSVLLKDIYYFDESSENFVFDIIASINLNTGSLKEKVYLIDSGSNLYVSKKNIYLLQRKSLDSMKIVDGLIEEVYLPLLDGEVKEKMKEILKMDNYFEKTRLSKTLIYDYSKTIEKNGNFSENLEKSLSNYYSNIQKEMDKTIIHKIGIDNGNIEYKTSGEVSGSVLNQFSMDEFDGYFRIATSFDHSKLNKNNLYILDKNLEIVGSLENMSPGERIYSVRFMGKRAYIVTFRNVDPLFVIDLENPENPEILGFLKVTGYSNYLHPYDETHLIGIGKETIENNETNSIWSNGVKISLFDVSDVKNPIEVDKIEIGERGSYSEALYDHKSVLFDKEKKLLVIPMSVSIINKTILKERYNGKVPSWAYGRPVWEGAYVFNIDLDGIKLKGRITHNENNSNETNQIYQMFSWKNKIRRSLYIGDVLYTLSPSIIKANNLDNLKEINKLNLESSKNYPV